MHGCFDCHDSSFSFGLILLEYSHDNEESACALDVRTFRMTSRYIFHIAIAEDWYNAKRHDRAYTTSTRGRTLDQQGYIHCSFADQVDRIAKALYADVKDVLIIRLDTALIDSVIKVEAADQTGEAFPHIYGPIMPSAVVSTRVWSPQLGGLSG